MDKSVVTRFNNPTLAINYLQMNEGSISFGLHGEEYSLQCASSRRQSVYNRLSKMMRQSPTDLRNALQNISAESRDLVSQLDDVGAFVDGAVQSCDDAADFMEYVAGCKQHLRAMLSITEGECQRSDAVIKAIGDGNFIADTLELYIDYLQCHSPLTYAVLYYMLCGLDDVESCESSVAEVAMNIFRLGLYNLHDVYSQLNVFFRMVGDALAGKEAYLMPMAPVVGEVMSGNNFILLAERYINNALSEVGENSLIHMLNAGVADLQAAKLWYLNQYYVTKRYAPTVTAILTSSLCDEVRALLHQYYHEEVGHEGYEYKSCLALGLSQEEIAAYFPLPYHTLFADMLAALSSRDPLAYFASLYLVEGFGDSDSVSSMFYSHRNINELLRIAGNEHDELNEEYNHHHLPRLLGSCVATVSPESANHALRGLRLMLEVSYRSSELLYEEIITNRDNE